MAGEYRIAIDNNAPPVKLPKGRVPVAIMAPLKEEVKEIWKEERSLRQWSRAQTG